MGSSLSEDEEFLVVVDDEDRVLEHRSRRDCHADRSLLHRSTHVVVTTSSGLLLQRRGFAKDKSAGLWDSACSGHVQPGESYTEAAVRELEEELGIVVEPMFRGTCRVSGEGESELCGVHTLEHDGPFALQLPELAGICVFRDGELPADQTPALQQVLAWLAQR